MSADGGKANGNLVNALLPFIPDGMLSNNFVMFFFSIYKREKSDSGDGGGILT